MKPLEQKQELIWNNIADEKGMKSLKDFSPIEIQLTTEVPFPGRPQEY